MSDLGSSRHKLKIAIGAMVAIDIIAIALLFSPLVGSADSRKLQLNFLRADLSKKNREVEPLRGMDSKIVLAKTQIGDFYKQRFAASDSDLTNELGKLASQNRVKIQSVKYRQEDLEGPGIVPVAIEGTFVGDYLQLVRFINTLERSKVFFTVDGIELGSEGAGPVRLQITMHSFLRLGA
jgi:Tfp pilus assembly protein PilO